MGVRQKLSWSNISNLIAAAVLVVSFSVSLWRVYKVQEVETESGVSTIRVVHWQLEAGFREALDEIVFECPLCFHVGFAFPRRLRSEFEYLLVQRTQH